MKAYLKKLSKLLSISLSLAVILTVLPMNTVHLHAADLKETFEVPTSGNTRTTITGSKVQLDVVVRSWARYYMGTYNVQSFYIGNSGSDNYATISVTDPNYEITKITISLGFNCDPIETTTLWSSTKGSIAGKDRTWCGYTTYGTEGYFWKTVEISNINSDTVTFYGGGSNYRQIDVEYRIKHNHNFTYDVSGSSIIAKCTSDCPEVDYKNGYAVTLNVSDNLVYDGNTKDASLTTLSGYNAWPTDGITNLLAAKPQIKYVGRGDTNYTESTTAPINTGTYTASITVGDKTVSSDFAIAKRTATLAWSNTIFKYDGNAHKPTAELTDVVGTDSLSVSVTGEKTAAGTYTASASISGASINNYELSPENSTHSFTIDPKPVGELSYPAFDGFTFNSQTNTYIKDWTGQIITPQVVINDTINSVITSLTNETDYELSGELEDRELGFYTITVTGKGNYTGTTTLEWEIRGQSFQEGDITVTPYQGEYDGQEHSIGLVSSLSDVSFEYSTTGNDNDYSSNNPKFKDAGNYIVYYKALKDGHYTHTGSSSVDIEKKLATLSWGNSSFTYNGNEQKPVATVNNAISGDEITVEVIGGETQAGSYVATADALTGTDAHNYRLPSEEPEKSFTIAKAQVEVPSPKQETFTYNGNEQTCLNTNPAYEISNNARINAGSQTVTAVLKDKTNYEWVKTGETLSDYEKEADKEYTFTINKAQVIVPTPNTTQYTYNRLEQTFDLDTNTLYSIENNKRTDAGEQTVVVSLNDKNNYEWKKAQGTLTADEKVANKSYTFIIDPWDISTVATITADSSFPTYEFTGVVKNIQEVVTDGEVVLEYGKDYFVTGNSGIEPGDYTLTVNFAGNYTGSKSSLWHIVEKVEHMGEVELDPTKGPFTGEVKFIVAGDEEVPKIEFEHPEHLLEQEDYLKLKGNNLDYGASKVIIEIILSLNGKTEEEINILSLEEIEKVIGNPTGVHYYDISLRKVIKYIDNDVVKHIDIIPVTECPDEIELTLHEPEEIPTLESGYSRKYSMIRSHWDNNDNKYVAESLAITHTKATEESPATFTFKSDKFSDYVLIYKDTLIPRYYKAPDTSVR